MKNFSFGIGLALFVCACEVDVVVEDGTTSSATGTSTSKASSSSSSSASTGTTNTSSSSVGGSGGSTSTGVGGADTCDKMKSILLSNVVLLDAGGDGVWSPGEVASMLVTMTNDSFADNFDYPGFSVSADVAGVTSTGNTLFGIFGGSSTDVAFQVASDATTPAGTDVKLTLAVTTLNTQCSDLDTLEATFTLE